MPHTAPDWSWMGRLQKVYNLQDLGELAARLGSISTYDRRGNIIYQDGFEAGLRRGSYAVAGAGSEVAIEHRHRRNGGYSLLLAVGAVADAQVVWTFRANYLEPGGHGLEWHMAWQDVFNLFQVDFQIHDGVWLHRFVVEFDLIASRIRYRDAGWVWQTLVPTPLLGTWENLFHAFKLVVNDATDGYMRFLWDDQEVSMAGIGCTTTLSPIRRSIYATFTFTEQGVLASRAWLDDVILTQNEL